MKGTSFIMTQESLLELTGMQVLGEEKNLHAVGTILGYPVLATADKKSLTLKFTVAGKNSDARKLNKKLREDPELKGKINVLNNLSGNVEANTLYVVISPADEADAKTLYPHVINSLEEAMKEFDSFFPPTLCAICNNENSDTLAMYGGILNIVHRECLENWVTEESKKFEDKEGDPKTFNGLIGGVVGGIVGALPALLVLVFFEYFVFVLFALIPVASAFGWRLFGGKFSRLTTVVVIVLSLFISIFLDIVATFILLRDYIYTYWGETITFMETLRYLYLDIEAFIYFEVFRDTLLALLGAVVGIFISWRFITKTDSDSFAEAQSALNDAVPLNR